jgi:hypothetical protein
MAIICWATDDHKICRPVLGRFWITNGARLVGSALVYRIDIVELEFRIMENAECQQRVR